ncbi:MAG: sigma-70 family RNA polymerase sigma factor [Planctomycetaceae bacterium]|nr:sigma-70 family RNA polymerase sigma factor [Planctomycetales bacterium]MCB9923182.1 sigma-70 family RNA polymerase sigma factor [Planctomycetaceae bacterium]
MNSGPSQSSSSTSPSLIERARDHEPEAWQRLTQIYTPLVYAWVRQAGLQSTDAADVGQEVFRTVSQRIVDFQQDYGAGFRGWLWGITRNKLRELARRQANSPQAQGGTVGHQQLQSLADVPEEESGDLKMVEPRSRLMHRALEIIQAEFEPPTWQAFWRSAVDDQRTAEIAADLQMTSKAVRQAKYRVMRRLRLELDDLC